MKNILLENMLRFGTKNLSEKTQRTLRKLAEQSRDTATILPATKNQGLKQAIAGGIIPGQIAFNIGTPPVGFIATNLAIVPNLFGTGASLVAGSQLNKNRGPLTVTGEKLTNNRPENMGAAVISDENRLGIKVNDGFISKVGSDIRDLSTSNTLTTLPPGNGIAPKMASWVVAYNIIVEYAKNNIGTISDVGPEIDRIMIILNKVPSLFSQPWDQNAVGRLAGMFEKSKYSKGVFVPKLKDYKTLV